MNATGHRFANGQCVACNLRISSEWVREKCIDAWVVYPGTILAAHSPLIGRCIALPVGPDPRFLRLVYTPPYPTKPKKTPRNWPALAPLWILLGFLIACMALHVGGAI